MSVLGFVDEKELVVRKALILLLLIAVAGGGGWYFGQHPQGAPFEAPDLSDLFGKKSDGRPVVARTTNTIRVASFNIQVYGKTKAGKQHVMDILARILRQFDVIAIQEIRSRDQSVLPQLVDIINADGRHYDYAIGPRLGNTTSKEQYAYIFDTASIELDRFQLYTVNDPDNQLHREPYIGWFRVRGPEADQAFTFSLANLHTDPDVAEEEVSKVGDIYRVVRDDGRQEDDVIVLGDFNASAEEIATWANFPGMSVVVGFGPTNTRGTEQYDNVLFHEQATNEFTGRGGVFDFKKAYNLTLEQALEVSDHLPVWAEFSIYEGGSPGRIARR